MCVLPSDAKDRLGLYGEGKIGGKGICWPGVVQVTSGSVWGVHPRIYQCLGGVC